MRILVLDDMDVRHDGFVRRFKDHKIDHAYTAEEAIHHLNMRKYDLVCLDHDLAPEHYVDGDTKEPSGFDVAVFMSEMPKDKLPTQVLIHSWNPVGADRMKVQLHGLGMFVTCKPF
jgi:hypothetical protein